MPESEITYLQIQNEETWNQWALKHADTDDRYGRTEQAKNYRNLVHRRRLWLIVQQEVV